MKSFIGAIIIVLSLGFMAKPVMAQNLAMAEASAQKYFLVDVPDPRVSKLEAYLETHNSPLSKEADYFVSEADRLGLDWKLVVAIAGVESTFGKFVPRNSYNGWGWAIYTGQSDGRHFSDWKEGITVVSEGLKYKYIDRGATTIEQIGRIYAASPAWSSKVRFFLQKIDDFEPIRVEHLTVTI